MRTYAIGDIHGQLDKLISVHQFIAEDRKRTGDADAPIIHLGDLVDRGPDSKGVIDYLMRGMADGAPWLTIKGNHDRMFGMFMDDPDSHDPGLRRDLWWTEPRLGGGTTLASYGVAGAGERGLHELHAEARERVPTAHLDFLAGLPTHVDRGDVFFVHAGIRPGVPFEAQTEDDLLWIRPPFLNDTRDHGKLIVHGHTPVDVVTDYGNRLNVDTGAGYGRALSAVVIEGSEIHLVGPAGRAPVLRAAR